MTFVAMVQQDRNGRYSFYNRDMGRAYIVPHHSDPRFDYVYTYDKAERDRIARRKLKRR